MTETQWTELLDREPGNAECREAYSRWLIDMADEPERGEFQAWLAEQKLWPTNSPVSAEEKGWCWYWAGGDLPDASLPLHATLSDWWLDHMPRARWSYPTRKEAEEVLFQAWQKAPRPVKGRVGS